MILAVDVAYSEPMACAAAVLFQAWESSEITRDVVIEVQGVAEYVPGQFYLRELPCIEQLLEQIHEPLDCIVIDGYVTLGADASPGLGLKLWETLQGKIPVVGVAKSEFIGTPENMRVYRGASAKPLFVSAIGMPLEDAKRNIAAMKGEYRLPDFLKAVDRLCRDGSVGTA